MEIACLFIFWNLAALNVKHFVTNLKAKKSVAQFAVGIFSCRDKREILTERPFQLNIKHRQIERVLKLNLVRFNCLFFYYLIH